MLPTCTSHPNSLPTVLSFGLELMSLSAEMRVRETLETTNRSRRPRGLRPRTSSRRKSLK